MPPHERRCKVLRMCPEYTKMAEGEGFEPSVPLRAQRFSRPPDSTTLAPLQNAAAIEPGSLNIILDAVTGSTCWRLVSFCGLLK